MKLKITLSILLLVIANIITAQPILTALTSIPTAGLSEIYNQNRNFLAGMEGTNQIWDFSIQTFFIQKNYKFEPCNNINNCTLFPGTTVVGNQTTDSIYSYYKGSQEALSVTGLAVYNQNGIPLPYTNFQDYFHFPFTFGNSFVDSWDAGYTSTFGPTFYRFGIDSIEADGWGTLITPAGTFTNSLRVKRISTYKDCYNSDTIVYKVVLYTWHDVSHKDILYSTSSSISNVNGLSDTMNFSTYVVSQQTGFYNMQSTKLNLQISPNPAHDKVQVAISLEAKTTVNINITDITGRVVYKSKSNNLSTGENKIDINTSGIPAGLYVVRIMAGDAIATSKLVIQ